MHGPEKRFKPRLSSNQPVIVTIFSGEESNSFRGKLVDASRSGLGIIVESAVALGTVVEVRADGGAVYGQVHHCADAPGGGFRIGVAVEEGLSGEWLVR
jgi:PilZ domain